MSGSTGSRCDLTYASFSQAPCSLQVPGTVHYGSPSFVSSYPRVGNGNCGLLLPFTCGWPSSGPSAGFSYPRGTGAPGFEMVAGSRDFSYPLGTGVPGFEIVVDSRDFSYPRGTGAPGFEILAGSRDFSNPLGVGVEGFAIGERSEGKDSADRVARAGTLAVPLSICLEPAFA